MNILDRLRNFKIGYVPDEPFEDTYHRLYQYEIKLIWALFPQLNNGECYSEEYLEYLKHEMRQVPEPCKKHRSIDSVWYA